MTLRLQFEGPAGRILANYRQRVALGADGTLALSMSSSEPSDPVSNQLATGISRAWQWFMEKRRAQMESKRLRVTETVSLGEKRFVALVRVDGRQFLVGGGPQGVSLLAQLGAESAEPKFPDILRQQLSGDQDPK